MALLGIVVTLVIVAFDVLWYAAVPAGVAVAAIGLIPVRGRALAASIHEAVKFRLAKRDVNSVVVAPAFDVPVPDTQDLVCGLRWDDDYLIAMLRIDPGPEAVTLLQPGAVIADEVVPLPEIADCLAQFDIELDSIDIIAAATRITGDDKVSRLYERVLGPLPAVADQTVYLVLRLDPLANASAVDSRGGGPTGALRSAIIATRRVANRLAARGLSVSLLTAAQMDAAVVQLTGGGISPAAFDETPLTLQHNGIRYTSYRLDPEMISAEGVAAIWATPTVATTLTLRLRRSPKDGKDGVALQAMVRLDTRGSRDLSDLDQAPQTGLRNLRGRQRRALLHSLPIGQQGSELALDTYYGPVDALRALPLPTGGCGQLLGADQRGNAVALPLIGPRVRRVEIVGSLRLAQQVVLRAIALGGRVSVHTQRPDAWRAMVTNVDSPPSLSFAAEHGTPVGANVLMYDAVPPTTGVEGATVIWLRHPDSEPDFVTADVTLTQSREGGNAVTIQAGNRTLVARMVTTQEEMYYFGAIPHSAAV